MSEQPSSAETTAPYGTGQPGGESPELTRIRTHHLREMKERGERFAMLTAYEQYAAQTFDEAGIEVLLVGDSASNNVYGNETSLAGHRRRADPADPRGDPQRPPGAGGRATCRSAPTRPPPSRRSTPRSAS